MRMTLLCNAGFTLEAEDYMVLVDTPNENLPPFFGLPDQEWRKIYDREPPYDRVCGLWFTHEHPDHCHKERVIAYHTRWPRIPIFLPELFPTAGKIKMGPFVFQYRRMNHAPIDNPPIHVVTLVVAQEKSIYLSADAALDCEAHRDFLQHRKCTAAVWNSMYLSRPDTRILMRETTERNFICHMPRECPDIYGLWKKLENNFKRYEDELQSVTVLSRYPTIIEL